MGKRKWWTAEEVQYLEENWGITKITTMAEALGRTESAIITKARRMGLGLYYEAQGRLTGGSLSREIGVHNLTVLNWIEKHGLKALRKKTSHTRAHWQIDTDDFWKWAERNQWRFDSKNLEPLVLGVEPEWMKEKRRRDMQLPRRKKRHGGRKGAWYTEERYWQITTEVKEKKRRGEAI